MKKIHYLYSQLLGNVYAKSEHLITLDAFTNKTLASTDKANAKLHLMIQQINTHGVKNKKWNISFLPRWPFPLCTFPWNGLNSNAVIFHSFSLTSLLICTSIIRCLKKKIPRRRKRNLLSWTMDFIILHCLGQSGHGKQTTSTPLEAIWPLPLIL